MSIAPMAEELESSSVEEQDGNWQLLCVTQQTVQLVTSRSDSGNSAWAKIVSIGSLLGLRESYVVEFEICKEPFQPLLLAIWQTRLKLLC